MNVGSPHYLLFSGSGEESEPGRWRFVLRAAAGPESLEADDVEPDVRGERLELLAVVRGLEALDQPSRVTLVTPSNYVLRGIRHGLSEWRRNGWRWECFGQMVPVKNRDLWQRVDQALQFHRLECRNYRFDPPHEIASPAAARADRKDRKAGPSDSPPLDEHGHGSLLARCRQAVARRAELCVRALEHARGAGLSPLVWVNCLVCGSFRPKNGSERPK